jgi:hypothetical protein
MRHIAAFKDKCGGTVMMPFIVDIWALLLIAALWAVFCLPGKVRELKQDREMQERRYAESRRIAAMTDDELAAEIEATARWLWGRHR